MVLFNTTTVITVPMGVLTLYVSQLLINIAIVRLLITPGVLRAAIHHAVSLGDYLWLACLCAGTCRQPQATAQASESLDLMSTVAMPVLKQLQAPSWPT